MFDADRPIQRCDQDRLNRALFAKYLARCLLDHQDSESFVIGLSGQPASGKTSLINMILDELASASANSFDHEKPIILNFSPWSYSGSGQLIYNFYRRLSATLRQAEHFANQERIIYLLELYASFFTHKPIPTLYRPQRSLGEKLTFMHQESALGWESGRDPTQVKIELNHLLRQQTHKIIIFIDNISRLYPDEIKQVLQIVKSMGDYARTLYVLAYEQRQVINAIDSLETKGSGKIWLNKVVQLHFKVPKILTEDLENIFVENMQFIMRMVPEDSWNANDWAAIYYSSLKYFFKNCRDITQYINLLNFSYPRVRDVVNPVDFFALTAIEVFLPKIYAGIRDNKDLFSDLLDHVYLLTKDQIAKERTRLEEILARDTTIDRGIVWQLLLQLFPRLQHLSPANKIFYYSDAKARKLRRIASPDLFEVYFRLALQSAQLPQTEFLTLLNTADDAQAFDQALMRLNQDNRILKFLNLLDGPSLQVLSSERAQIIINALFDNADLFPQGEVSALSLSTPMRIHRIIQALLNQHADTEVRFTILQTAIAHAEKSIYIIVHELTVQGLEHEESSTHYLPEEFRTLMPEELSSLKKLTLTKIKLWAEKARLAEHPQFRDLLLTWRLWSDDESYKRYVQTLTDNDKGLVTFLKTSYSKAIDRMMQQLQKDTAAIQEGTEYIKMFIAPEHIVEHAKIIFQDPYFEKLTESEMLGVLIFLEVMQVQALKWIPKTTV